MKFLFLLIAAFDLCAAENLAEIAENVFKKSGPVVIFDLDDTLYSSSSRTKAIFEEYLEVRSGGAYQIEKNRLANVAVEEIRYGIADTLRGAGISDKSFIEEVEEFWAERFFTSEYTLIDAPLPGARAYVAGLYARGVKIVYLTGRDDSMRSGTLESLRSAGFPLEPGRAVLITKSDPEVDDVVYKKSAFKEIEKLGNVAAFFENEPENLNAMADYFGSCASAVFLDTKHSPTEERPVERALVVRDYLE